MSKDTMTMKSPEDLRKGLCVCVCGAWGRGWGEELLLHLVYHRGLSEKVLKQNCFNHVRCKAEQYES